jgi:hypothetical protein
VIVRNSASKPTAPTCGIITFHGLIAPRVASAFEVRLAVEFKDFFERGRALAAAGRGLPHTFASGRCAVGRICVSSALFRLKFSVLGCCARSQTTASVRVLARCNELHTAPLPSNAALKSIPLKPTKLAPTKSTAPLAISQQLSPLSP